MARYVVGYECADCVYGKNNEIDGTVLFAIPLETLKDAKKRRADLMFDIRKKIYKLVEVKRNRRKK